MVLADEVLNSRPALDDPKRTMDNDSIKRVISDDRIIDEAWVSMENTHLYHYKMNRRKRSTLFIRMGLACLAYIAGLYAYEYYSGKVVVENFRSIYIYSFLISSLVLFYTAWWHLRNPATYVATITSQRFIVNYPGSSQWSFDVSISDIVRFEHRRLHSRAGRGIAESGIVMKSGEFHEIVMNYGNRINKMHATIKDINPNITFSKKVNKKA